MGLSLLLAVQVALGQAPGALEQPAPPIADNSFLVEEAYNQEPGVVQHISTVARSHTGRDWTYTFTQEWPVNPYPKHQISYTASLLSNAVAKTGLGDVWVTWRYQALSTDTVAWSPRVSVSLPTGSTDTGRGSGNVGLQVAVPVSVATRSFAFHANLGATARPDSFFAGQSVVWLARPRFNVLVELAAARAKSSPQAGPTHSTSDVVLSPGVRWAHNFRNGLQIVPGLAVPIELAHEDRGQWSVLGYLSLEHPFGSAR